MADRQLVLGNRESRAFLFPGQGSQMVGMGKELAAAFPVARDVFEEVDDCLRQKLSRIMFEGPDDALTLTENTQPAIMASSLAVFRVLQKECGLNLEASAAFVAGHSLGEYSALAAAGTFSLADTARLLKLRGKAMQEAVPQGQGAMAALLGLDYEQALAVVEEAAAVVAGDVCEVSNDNAPGQVVISGGVEAVERAMAIAQAKGAKRAVKLNVSAPFHCSLMAPAAERMQTAFSETKAFEPLVPVVANVSAQAEDEPVRIKSLLVEQVTAMVRWRESVAYLKQQGITEVVEIGTGKVLSGLVKRIDRDINTCSIETPQDIDAFFKQWDVSAAA